MIRYIFVSMSRGKNYNKTPTNNLGAMVENDESNKYWIAAFLENIAIDS